ncbi:MULTISPECIES: hypothetical protein [unclassified Streptomyces]|uniref:hypothetical protein n=1 Tax=unclassified Streptomyces TaxID=2593676 RepID=UPI001660A792|nr:MULTISPECIES: hypothetical protein [unclassified Streptomyces]MBD0710965.1 hypothetical protein [Streptomyces sp. CBMA291]MBD0717500.1 hypothetical protein [Streptomyces sp. CBMA370]
MAEKKTGPGAGHSYGGIRITNTGGNVTIGDHNKVTQTTGAVPPGRDPAQEELLEAVRRLRADLEGVVANAQTTALAAELADAEDEIEGTGRAGTGRLTRLRSALADAGAVTGVLASGVAAVQAVGALLGG